MAGQTKTEQKTQSFKHDWPTITEKHIVSATAGQKIQKKTPSFNHDVGQNKKKGTPIVSAMAGQKTMEKQIVSTMAGQKIEDKHIVSSMDGQKNMEWKNR